MMHYIGQKSTIINETVQSINENVIKKNSRNSNYKKSGNKVARPIKSSECEFFFDNNEAIANCIDIKKDDIINTNYINVELGDVEDVSFYEKLLNDNKEDFALIMADHKLYGAGCGEIITLDESSAIVDHIPNGLVEILLVAIDGVEYPIVEIKDYKNKVTGYCKIFNYFYPENFPDNYKEKPLGLVFWYGGGQFNNFYDKPFYLQLLQEINSQIVIRDLDTKTFNSGNQLSGIVVISRSGVDQLEVNGLEELEPPEDDEESVTSQVLPQNVEVLKKEINKPGFGNAFFYEESDTPLKAEYINLTNNNQDYILKKLDSMKTEIYRRAKIPKERFMDTSIKESMNSKKTVAIWEMYITGTNSEQQPFEKLLSDYLFFVYEIDPVVSITVPEFEEHKIAKSQIILEFFNNGIVTLENAVLELNKVFDWIWTDNLDNWICKERLYNGRLLTDITNTSPATDELIKGVTDGVKREINPQ